MRHAFIMILLLAMAGACTSPRPSAEFNIAIESFPGSLDPRYPSGAYASKIQELIFNGLLKFDQDLRLVPDLAEAYEYQSDKEIKFSLRKDVKFHDGRPLTAGDVAHTYESISQPGSKSILSGTFRKIKQVKILNDHELIIELKQPFAPILTALTVGIVPKGDDKTRLIGTGPYRYLNSKKDQWIRLEANSDYFGGTPSLKSLEFKTVGDDTTRVLQILRGEVELIQNAVPLVMASWLKARDQLNFLSDEGVNYNYLAFNLRDPILKNRKVRLAIAMAINREVLIKYQLKGFARLATGILSPSNWYYEPHVSHVDFDPETAKGLLDEAGFKDPDGDGPQTRFVLEYKTSNRRDRVAMARAIGRYLEAVGIGVNVRPFEWGTFYRDIRTGNFQIFTSTWVGVTDPDIYHNVFHSEMIPPMGANRGYFENEVVDELLNLARVEVNPDLRKQYYSQVQKLISLELPYVSLWYEDNVAFLRKNVVGYELRPNASFLGLLKTKLVKKKK